MSDENDKDGALMCHQLGRILSFLLGLGILPTQLHKVHNGNSTFYHTVFHEDCAT